MYTGQFRDVNEALYTVNISPKNNPVQIIPIIFSGNPVSISQKSNGLFSPIKTQTCTIEILNDTIYSDMYASDIKDVTVTIINEETNNTIFNGYLTPYIYSQPFAHTFDTLQLEAVSKISVLKEIDYKCINSTPQIASFKDIIWHILTEGAGYDEDTLKIKYLLNVATSSTEDRTYRLADLFISESNFFDNDDERTPWKMEEVLSEMLRYLGLTMFEYNDIVYLMDYQTVSNYKDIRDMSFNYITKTNISDLNSTSTVRTTISITKDDFASDDSSVSHDDIYNKLTVNVNTYKIEELCKEIEDLSSSKNLSGYPSQTTWSKTEGKRKNKQTFDTYYELQTLRLLNSDSNWYHRYYKMSTGVELSSPYDPNSTSQYNTNVYPRVNTRSAIVTRYTGYPANEPVPTKLDWSTCLAFYCLDDTITPSGSFVVINNENLLEQPVLESRLDDPIVYSPKTGISWITFKGDLFYQCNRKNVSTAINTTNKYYTFSPMDDATDTTSFIYETSYNLNDHYNTTYTAKMPRRSSASQDYGKGWPILKAKLKIGDKYWNGSTWTTTESVFQINYSNRPKNGAEETINCFEWTSVAPNFNYESKIDTDCWAIPIKPTDNVAGNLSFTLYTPSQLRPVFTTKTYWWDEWEYPTSWTELFPVIYMKDIELNYVYTDTGVWYLTEEENDNDILYTNEVDTNYTREMEDIECKINTTINNIPVSRSAVCDYNKKFIDKLYHFDIDNSCTFEEALIIKYLNHYSSKKLILEASINTYGGRGKFAPYSRYMFIFNQTDVFNNSDGSRKYFFVDDYTLDVKNQTAKVKFIEW